MTKIKHLLLFVCMAGCLTACKKDNIEEDNFDELAQFQADTTAIRNYVKANNISVLKDEEYGLFYQIIAPGTGDLEYGANTEVTAAYEGKLLDGTIFDTQEDAEFTIAGVIAGWQIGLPLIQKGGKVRLIIPSFYGYGHVRNGPLIPPSSILDFTVEIKDLRNP